MLKGNDLKLNIQTVLNENEKLKYKYFLQVVNEWKLRYMSQAVLSFELL